MRVDDTVYIGSKAYIIEVLAEIEREALLKYQTEYGGWKILGWRSFDDFRLEEMGALDDITDQARKV